MTKILRYAAVASGESEAMKIKVAGRKWSSSSSKVGMVALVAVRWWSYNISKKYMTFKKRFEFPSKSEQPQLSG